MKATSTTDRDVREWHGLFERAKIGPLIASALPSQFIASEVNSLLHRNHTYLPFHFWDQVEAVGGHTNLDVISWESDEPCFVWASHDPNVGFLLDRRSVRALAKYAVYENFSAIDAVGGKWLLTIGFDEEVEPLILELPSISSHLRHLLWTIRWHSLLPEPECIGDWMRTGEYSLSRCGDYRALFRTLQVSRSFEGLRLRSTVIDPDDLWNLIAYSIGKVTKSQPEVVWSAGSFPAHLAEAGFPASSPSSYLEDVTIVIESFPDVAFAIEKCDVTELINKLQHLIDSNFIPIVYRLGRILIPNLSGSWHDVSCITSDGK